MAKVISSIIIHRPIEEVFNFVNDFSAYPQWQHGVKEAKIVSSGPLGKGTQVVETRQLFGRSMQVSWEVTEFRPPYQRGFRISGPLSSTGVMSFESIPQGTRMQIQVNMNGRGLLGLFVPFLARNIQRQNAKDFARLKTLLEAKQGIQEEDRKAI